MHLCSRIFMVVALLATAVGTSASKPLPRANLTILCDDGLMLAMAELVRLYSTQTGTPLTVIATRDTDTAQQLEQGFEAHVLLTADTALQQRLSQRGLIDVFGTRDVVSTQLALVAPARLKPRLGLAKRISFAALLFSQPNFPVYVDDPQSISGARAQALMQDREFSSDLRKRAVVQPSLSAMREALRSTDSFALMPAATAIAQPDLVILSLLPASSLDPIRYDAVVLASEAMDAARDFTAFLRRSDAQRIFTRHGFHHERT